MTLKQIQVWTCDGCGNDDEGPADRLSMPDGWIHVRLSVTPHGAVAWPIDLCVKCGVSLARGSDAIRGRMERANEDCWKRQPRPGGAPPTPTWKKRDLPFGPILLILSALLGCSGGVATPAELGGAGGFGGQLGGAGGAGGFGGQLGGAGGTLETGGSGGAGECEIVGTPCHGPDCCGEGVLCCPIDGGAVCSDVCP